MKRFILFGMIVLAGLYSQAQVKISQLPTYSATRIDSLWLPVVDGNVTKKIRGYKMKTVLDSLYLTGCLLKDGDSLKIDYACLATHLSAGGGSASRFGIEDNTSTVDRNMDMGGNTLTINSSRSNSNTLSITNTLGTALSVSGTGNGLTAFTTDQVAVSAQATGGGGIGGQFISTIGTGLYTRGTLPLAVYSNNSDAANVTTAISIVRGAATIGASGMGSSIKSRIATSGGTIEDASNIITKWIDGTTSTRTSEFSITGVNNAVNHTYTFPSFTADRIIPLTVNNIPADATGNITIAGGGGGRFGVTGEDDVSTGSRTFSGGGNNILINNSLFQVHGSTYSGGAGYNIRTGIDMGLNSVAFFIDDITNYNHTAFSGLIDNIFPDGYHGIGPKFSAIDYDTNKDIQVIVQPGKMSLVSSVFTTEGIRLNLGPVTNYSDNAAAITAGLMIGDIYRNGDLIQVVH